MRRHSIRRHNPATLAELMGNGKFVKVVVVFGIEAEGNEWEALASSLTETESMTHLHVHELHKPHDDEAELLKGGSQIISSASKILHD